MYISVGAQDTMHETYYGILAGISLLGLLVSMFGSVGESQVGLGLAGASNGLSILISCKRKCKHTEST